MLRRCSFKGVVMGQDTAAVVGQGRATKGMGIVQSAMCLLSWEGDCLNAVPVVRPSSWVYFNGIFLLGLRTDSPTNGSIFAGEESGSLAVHVSARHTLSHYCSVSIEDTVGDYPVIDIL
jgi:hypothetical protein